MTEYAAAQRPEEMHIYIQCSSVWTRLQWRFLCVCVVRFTMVIVVWFGPSVCLHLDSGLHQVTNLCTNCILGVKSQIAGAILCVSRLRRWFRQVLGGVFISLYEDCPGGRSCKEYLLEPQPICLPPGCRTVRSGLIVCLTTHLFACLFTFFNLSLSGTRWFWSYLLLWQTDK